MATVEIDGQSIGHATVGDVGEPVLLLHGTAMSRAAFDGVIAAMPAAAAYRYVVMDLPGSGESSLPSSALTVHGLAAQAHQLMSELGHDRYHVAGFSLGAMVAAGIASAHHSSVRSVTLMAGWITSDARMKATFELWRRLIAIGPELFVRYALVDGFTAAAQEQMAPMLDAAIAVGAGTVAPGSHAQIDLDIAADISEIVGLISAPTLILSGAEDRWVDVTNAHALGRAIAGSRVEVLPIGHMMI
ncbi:MAG: alpha/beta hydrolase, partial [Actinobacteria bacterium]|nr:alpha/beta hydrolase [Actinomycetota bacterium]